MDMEEPRIETETRRRRRRSLFRHRQVPVRMLVPNFFTLLGLCAGLTSIRMGIEGRYDLALAAMLAEELGAFGSDAGHGSQALGRGGQNPLGDRKSVV